MSRKGLIVVEQMPVLLIRTLIHKYMGVITSSDPIWAQPLMAGCGKWRLFGIGQ